MGKSDGTTHKNGRALSFLEECPAAQSRKGIWLLTQPRSGAGMRQTHTFLQFGISVGVYQAVQFLSRLADGAVAVVGKLVVRQLSHAVDGPNRDAVDGVPAVNTAQMHWIMPP